MGVLSIIPVIVDIHGNRFEVYSLESEMHENVDLVLGIKNVFELEGFINLCESCFSFLNRSIPFFSKEQIVLKQRAETYNNRSSFCRRNFGHGYSQNARHMRPRHSHVKT